MYTSHISVLNIHHLGQKAKLQHSKINLALHCNALCIKKTYPLLLYLLIGEKNSCLSVCFSLETSVSFLLRVTDNHTILPVALISSREIDEEKTDFRSVYVHMSKSPVLYIPKELYWSLT